MNRKGFILQIKRLLTSVKIVQLHRNNLKVSYLKNINISIHTPLEFKTALANGSVILNLQTIMQLPIMLGYLYRFASFTLYRILVILHHKEKVSNEVEENALALLFSLNYVQRIQSVHGRL